jgi:hypothetical protein
VIEQNLYLNLNLVQKTGETLINYPDNGSHAFGLSDRCQTCDPTSDDQHFCRRNFSGGGDLASEEPAEVIGGFDDSSVEITDKKVYLIIQ